MTPQERYEEDYSRWEAQQDEYVEQKFKIYKAKKQAEAAILGGGATSGGATCGEETQGEETRGDDDGEHMDASGSISDDDTEPEKTPPAPKVPSKGRKVRKKAPPPGRSAQHPAPKKGPKKGHSKRKTPPPSDSPHDEAPPKRARMGDAKPRAVGGKHGSHGSAKAVPSDAKDDSKTPGGDIEGDENDLEEGVVVLGDGVEYDPGVAYGANTPQARLLAEQTEAMESLLESVNDMKREFQHLQHLPKDMRDMKEAMADVGKKVNELQHMYDFTSQEEMEDHASQLDEYFDNEEGDTPWEGKKPPAKGRKAPRKGPAIPAKSGMKSLGKPTNPD